MPPEPAQKRAVVFVDGQNLFHSVRESFGYTYPGFARRMGAACCARLLHSVRPVGAAPCGRPSGDLPAHPFQ
jgi:hypothetical protein